MEDNVTCTLFLSKLNIGQTHCSENSISSYNLWFCTKGCLVICDTTCTRTNICWDQSMQFGIFSFFDESSSLIFFLLWWSGHDNYLEIIFFETFKTIKLFGFSTIIFPLWWSILDQIFSLIFFRFWSIIIFDFFPSLMKWPRQSSKISLFWYV